MAFIKFKNINVHFTSIGEGNSILLLHGFLENISMWDTIVSRFSKNSNVICIDLLGHGKTENLGYVHTMEMQAEMVIHVLNALNIKTYDIIGHSMGGYVALALAEMNPQFIRKLCLMNSTALPDTDEKRRNRDRGIEAVKYNPEIFVRMAIPNLFSEENKNHFSGEINSIIVEALKMSQQGIIAAMEGMKIRKDRAFLYKSLKFPIQLIIGKQDPALDYASLIQQSKNTPIVIVEFPDGHMSHIENKEVLISSLNRFIN